MHPYLALPLQLEPSGQELSTGLELASLAGPGAQRDALAAANLTADAWAIES